MKISVIVPVFRVEQYLPDCIDSILNQSFADYEVILIDDGSDDKCPSICDLYASASPRITVIHQGNAGISCARNAGLRAAKGEYITFVDSDDIIDEHYLSRMYSSITMHNADMVIAQYIDFTEKPSVLVDSASDNGMIISGRDACLRRYAGDKKIFPAVWGKLYRRKLFDNLYFPVGKIHEDQYVTSVALYLCKKIVVLNQALYYYRLRENSITSSVFTQKRFDNILLMNDVIGYYRAANDSELVCAAKKHRQKTLALYTVLAKAEHIRRPNGCRMTLLRAFFIVRSVYGRDKCEWYLSKIYPKMVPWYNRAESLAMRIRRRVSI